jgi:hypothetical protein
LGANGLSVSSYCRRSSNVFRLHQTQFAEKEKRKRKEDAATRPLFLVPPSGREIEMRPMRVFPLTGGAFQQFASIRVAK